MKTLFGIALSLLISISAQAQSKITNTTLEVDGVCGMCKKRIENAAYLPGVKKVNWDVETHALSLTFRNDKVSQEEIIASINEAGHDVESAPASTEQYENIHGCCRYRDGELRAEHGLNTVPMCERENQATSSEGTSK